MRRPFDLGLKLEDLLRYGFSGGAGLIALVVSYPIVACSLRDLGFLPKAGDTGEAVLAIGLVLLIGSLTYAVHRAVLYPLLLSWFTFVPFSFFGICHFERKFFVPWLVSHAEFEQFREHWRRHQDNYFAYPHLSEWGAINHFLYCSGWSILMAATLPAWITNVAEPRPAARFFFWLAIAILVAAHTSNVRLVYSQRRMYDLYIPSPKGPRNT